MADPSPNCLAVQATVKLPGQVDALCVKFPPGETDRVAVACSDGRVRVFNTAPPCEHISTLTAKPPKAQTAEEKLLEVDPCTAIAFPPAGNVELAGQLYAIYASGTLRRWHIGTKSCLTRSKPTYPGSLLALDVCPDGTEIAVCGESTYIELFNITAEDSKTQFGSGEYRRFAPARVTGHANRMHCVRYHPGDPNLIFSSGWDTMLMLWDKRERTQLKRVSGLYICGDGIDISLSTSEILTASYRPENSLQVWNLDLELSSSLTHKKDASNLYSCQFIPGNDKVVATAGSNLNELRLVEKQSGITIGRVASSKGYYACHVSSNGQMMVGGGASGTVTICLINIPTSGQIPACPAQNPQILAAEYGTQAVSKSWTPQPLPDAGYSFDLSDHDSDADDSGENM